MSDDEADPELLALLRQSLGLGGSTTPRPAETGVLEGAQHVYNNAIDVALDMRSTKAAATTIWTLMQQKGYSTKTWATHELHPQSRDESTVNFIFTMDLLNFCFWSERGPDDRFAIEYRGRRWTGYWSLVAALQRALDEGIPITSSDYWQNEDEFTEEALKNIFRSATDEEIPLFKERFACLREAGAVLYDVRDLLVPSPFLPAKWTTKEFACRFSNCIQRANHSAPALVNLLAENFPCFRDESRFEGRRVPILKRAQILVADLWACFDGEGYGRFDDIDKITMFADYRIPQMLHSLGCLQYGPTLEHHIRSLQPIEPNEVWEIELRGCSIWAIELIRRDILQRHPHASINAILIDFFLYDTVKEKEAEALSGVVGREGREGGVEALSGRQEAKITNDEYQETII
ncbi:MAG: hypothetical protein M1838_001969 [Thelocarpon superellum]|nr:MAG: hypothetical protein M1838_001969 [Thelocarpon superellum]